jgi:FixJ family two-component response regulator
MTVRVPLVYVVDDEKKVRDLLARVVRSFGYDAEPYASAAEFLEAVQSDRPACLLLDVHLAVGTGFELFDELERRGAELPTIFMTGAGTIPMGVQAMKAGAVEFLTKPIDFVALRAALVQASALAEAVAARRTEESLLRELLQRLTPRERAVLPYVVRGWPNKRIAAALSIVEQTVKVHRARIMQKLGMDSVADLVRLSERSAALGIDPPPADDTEGH